MYRTIAVGALVICGAFTLGVILGGLLAHAADRRGSR